LQAARHVAYLESKQPQTPQHDHATISDNADGKKQTAQQQNPKTPRIWIAFLVWRLKDCWSAATLGIVKPQLSMLTPRRRHCQAPSNTDG